MKNNTPKHKYKIYDIRKKWDGLNKRYVEEVILYCEKCGEVKKVILR